MSWRLTGMLRAGLVAGLAAGCSPASRTTVAVTWDTPGTWAPRVGGITLWGDGLPEAASTSLVEGKVTRTQALDLAQGRMPEALLDKRVPLLAVKQGSALLLWPRVRLARSQLYSVIAPGAGVVATFQTEPEERPLWRPLGALSFRPGQWASYCAEAPSDTSVPAESSEIQLPQGDLVPWRTGLGSAHIASAQCLEFRVPAREVYVLPPARIGDIDLAPDVLTVVDAEPGPEAGESASPSLTAQAGTIAVETACDFSVLHVQDSKGARREAVSFEGAAHVGPLEPDQSYEVDFVLGRGAVRLEGHMKVPLGPAAPRFVLSEVFADPKGAEPEGEWIEVANVGNGAGSLAGFSLLQADKITTLPDVTLSPGEFGLIVREDFLVDPAVDQVPASEARRVQVAELQLKNGGETLSLVDGVGVKVSVFPAKPAKAGVSVARGDLLQEDSQARFAWHASPGASPGQANTVEAP